MTRTKKTCGRCRALEAVWGGFARCELGKKIDQNNNAQGFARPRPMEACPKPITTAALVKCVEEARSRVGDARREVH